MEMEIIIMFCLIDDYLKDIRFKDDTQCCMSSSEVMLVALGAARFFGGNHEASRRFFGEKKFGYMRYMLSKSQLNRRLHAIPMAILEILQQRISEVFKNRHASKEFCMDSFPVAVCENIRISRSKIFPKQEEYRGYIASKKQYFFGLRVHMITTTNQEPVETIFTPGSVNDKTIYQAFDFDLPEGSVVYGDAAYNVYAVEDGLAEHANIEAIVDRAKNSTRPNSLWHDTLIQWRRKNIETTFSSVKSLFSNKIHAVTAKGFSLKIVCFILSYSLSIL
jgi:hypothetical protein